MRRWGLLVAGVILVACGLLLAVSGPSHAETVTVHPVRCVPGLSCHQVKLVARDLGDVTVIQRWTRHHIEESRTPGPPHWSPWRVVAITLVP